ncbi:uncharacterized protein LOC128182515 isoform X8 [Crassostrea angulata]|uniref:uncharacterized protein LOC128182515 isoform X8 n=1 Tax=Magallana angulata TaxID=2784310 RepID=UPI0022B0DAEE|nr:uncharacterized protein LOC128182515 isoform X8 [Crassostrea angulata]
MDYSERFKRYSRSDSKDSRSKLGSKDSRHASIPSKPGTMDSSNTAYTQGSRTSRKESGEPNGKLRDSDMNRAQRESGDFNGRLRGSGEMNSKHRETDYSRSYREGGEYNGNKSVRGGGESNGSKQAPKTKGRQTKDPQFQSEALVPVKTGRSSPGKLSSPRKLGKGEIPHNHPDRSYLFDAEYTPELLSIAEIKLESHLPRIYDFWGRPSIGVKTKGGSNDMGSYHFEGKGYFDPAIYIYPTSDNVPRSYLEEKEMECMAKDETIRMLNSKIRRLEHLLQLKDTRMLDLQGQIAREQGLYYVTSRKHVVK